MRLIWLPLHPQHIMLIKKDLLLNKKACKNLCVIDASPDAYKHHSCCIINFKSKCTNTPFLFTGGIHTTDFLGTSGHWYDRKEKKAKM